MEAIYVDLHIHTSDNADNLNKNYNIDELLKNINKKANGRQALISLTDHNTINKDAYLKFINKNQKNIKIILGTELHIKNHETKPAYHCHIYFDINNINDKEIDSLNEILDKLYPKKLVEKMDKSIPKIDKIINSFENYDFILIPHGGQNHATFETSIDPNSTCDETIERTIYYNQIEGFSARSNKGLEDTKEYLKKLGIGSFVNLITGSDNYNPTKYPAAKSDEASKFVPTWMYANPDFRGLKLALSEDSRLEYEINPTIDDYNIIKNIKLKNEKIDIDVELTQGLNVVIGESSSGKTLFVDSIMKKIKKEDNSNYEADFGVSEIEIEDALGAEPYYIEQNFITEKVKNNNELNMIPIVKDLFPEEEYKQELIDKELTNVKTIINDVLTNVKKVKKAEETIKKIPAIYNLVTKGLVEQNIIEIFNVDDNVLENIKYIQEEATQDANQIKEIKTKLKNNKLYYNRDMTSFDSVIKEIEYLKSKYKFQEKIRKIIQKNQDEYDKKINKANTANNKILTSRKKLTNAIKNYIVGKEGFKENIEKLSNINLEVETITRDFDDNKLYIKNNLKLSKEILSSIICNYLKTKKDKSLESLTPEDLYSTNFLTSKVKTYEELNQKLYADIIEKNKKIYKIIGYNGKDFDSLSPGWKTAIILDIMLKYNEDTAPLIIDQPEDNLANTYINQDLIKAIKTAKRNKQIIMVSHNATIPMLGDAQNIVLCRNIDNKIVIRSAKLEGMIDDKLVIDYIAEITDGGKKAIKKRFKKYNFKKYREE